MDSIFRAHAIQSAVRRSKIREQERGNFRLKLVRGPDLVRNADGDVIGIEVRVRLFRNGKRVKIDPHRVFINPPIGELVKIDPEDENSKMKKRNRPEKVFWQLLWDSVESYPNLDAERASR